MTRQTTSRRSTARQKAAAQTESAYKVGYGQPPLHTRFQKGQSGNPGGRPRRMPRERMKALMLREAYRKMSVKEHGRTVEMPAMLAILRSQIGLAARGNIQAQRAVIAAIETLEYDNMEAAKAAAPKIPPYTFTEAARRIAFIFREAEREQKEKAQKEKESGKEEAARQGGAAPPAAVDSPPAPHPAHAAAQPPAEPVAPASLQAEPWREPPPRPRFSNNGPCPWRNGV